MHLATSGIRSSPRRVAYIYSPEYVELASLLPSNIDRSKRVHALVEAYGLLKLRDLCVVSPRKASVKELCRYHSRDFIDFLRTVENTDEYQNGDEDDEQIDNLEEYGFRQDCSVFEGMASYAEYVAGSTIEAAALLADDAFDVVIHWDGGRHHAQKDRAEGFCYISDVVLGIMELQKEFPKVMYIDLDVHHGDGVENAFQVSDKVLTVSLHHFAEGFYPGTGSGKNLSPRSKAVVNIPLKAGLSDGNLNRIFDGMIEPLKESFSPDAIVLQCGVDGMAGDPLGKWNLGFDGYSHCLRAILSWKKPLIVLGGGGYKNSSAARCYAYLTSVVLGRDISADIPEHEYFEDYAPDFQLQVEPRRQPDENTKEYLEVVQALVIEQSKNVQLTNHNRV
ncbi:MAG: histone deacetylase 8-like protein [Podila humilis]|nr:MAG: histone deacetylase 8-like protein [Podila humilis]